MRSTWRKLLALSMTVILLAGSCGLSQTGSYVLASAQQTEADSATKDKTTESVEKDTKDNITSEIHQDNTSESDTKSSGKSDTTEDSTKKESSKDASTSGEDQEKGSEKESEKTTEKESDKESDKESEKNSDKTAEEATTEATDASGSEGTSTESTEGDSPAEEATTEGGMVFYSETKDEALFSSLGPHDVDMPDVTSHYFKLQKNSKKVSSASGTNLKVVSNAKEASQYIYSSMPDGNLYSFTPKKTSSTEITVGGGSGGSVSIATVKGSDYKHYGRLYDAAQHGNIQSHAFNLSKCSSQPYAIYTNVGSWYDPSVRKTYSVDMKLTVTGYLFPSEKIRKQLNNEYEAPYVAFHKNMIGLTVMGTDYVQTTMKFYYHGSSQEISNLHGAIQFCDVDAQQGIDFGSGFQKIIMFNTSSSHLQYSSTGLLSSSLGYVSSRTVADLTSADTSTTVLGLFSGSTVTCRWTLAKCDHKDTGGSAAYAVSSGYGIPADSTQKDSTSYFYSNSTGFLGIYTDVGLIPLPPEVQKNEYSGDVDASKSAISQKELSLTDRQEVTTFVLSAAAASPSDFSKVKYTGFSFSDSLEAAFSLKQEAVRVYTEASLTDTSAGYQDVTSWFDVFVNPTADHKTTISVNATSAAMKSENFYGRTYYVHIPVSIRSEEELSAWGLSLKNWYQKDNTLGQSIGSGQSYQGVFAVGNTAQLIVFTNQGTNADIKTGTTGVRIPMRIAVRKLGDDSDTPVAGVTFGLYGGSPDQGSADAKALMTAVTDQDGYAVFESNNDTFFTESYGDGPYYIREMSIPDVYANVWNPSVNTAWSFTISSISDVSLLTSRTDLISKLASKDSTVQGQLLYNTEKNNPKNSVKIYKKSADTGEWLEGAEFMLYQWSEKAGKYMELMPLSQGKDDDGRICYQNDSAFSNTMDNLGRYEVKETKAPSGCLLNDSPWEFSSNENTELSTHTFSNALQKVRLELTKEGEEKEKLSGVRFRVKAAEDIYAPWVSEDEEKKEDSLLVAKGTVVDTLTTDGEGLAVTSEGHELYVGDYLVEEIEGAEGYIMDSTPHRISLNYSTEIKDAVVSFSMTLTNEKMRPSMSISKLADHTVNATGTAVAFNEKTGRYTEQKVSGIYEAGEKVDYTITVTNTGNTDLHELLLRDSMDEIDKDSGYALKDYVNKDSAAFVIPTDGYYVSSKGDKITASYKDGDAMKLVLDKLAVGDSVQVHFTAEITKEAANVFHLKNDVVLSAEYAIKQGEDIKPEYVSVPTEDLLDEDGNPLTEDYDHINVPGKALTEVAKLADRTTGVSLVNGRYEGKKMEGTYEYGEDVDFTVTVTNSGTANLFQILVQDTPDEALRKALDETTISFKDGTYTTAFGEELHAVTQKSEEGTYTLLLDYLLAGDSVVLHLTGKVKSGVLAASSLKNIVKISAEYQTGKDTFEAVPETPEMKDEDSIGIGVPELAIAKIADRTTGATLEDGRYSGTKNAGSYEAGDSITFTITVTNQGNGLAKDVTVDETPSDSLRKYVTVLGYQLQLGENITSIKGNTISVTACDTNSVTFDQLPAGDSVELIYECQVNESITTVSGLKNVAKVTGKNRDGSSVPDREEMTDQDAVNLKKQTTPASGTTYTSSTPKTGDSTDPVRNILIGSLALMGLACCIWRRKKDIDQR